MRFLLHNSNADFDAATKTWFFHLDRRISNPTSLGVNKATFSPVSTLSPMPHVIYMHSRALSDIWRDKHTVVLRGDSHENNADVIAVLEETHTRGRYALKDKVQRFPVKRGAVARSIDIYFTDGTGANLDGEIGAGGGGQPAGAADDSTIEALSDLVMWLDFSDFTRMLDGSYVQISGTPGDRFHTLQNRSPGTVGLIWAANTYEGMQLAAFGPNTFGMIGYNSWAAMSDNSNNNPIVGAGACSYSALFQVPPTTTGSALFKNNANFEFVMDNNTFSWPDGTGGYTIVQTTFMPNTRWFMQVSHEEDYDGDGTIAVSGLFRNLATGQEYTQTGTRPANVSNAFTNWAMSNASGHFEQIQSHIIITNNIDAADLLTIKNWMLAKYAVEAAAEPDPAPVTEDATFFAELDITIA